MLSIDKISLLVTVSTELRMKAIERKLNAKGYTLNYFTPPDNRLTLAEVLRERRPNLYAAAFGGIEELCISIHLRQKDGRIFSNVLTPRSATGPSLKNMAIGSLSALGEPIQATLKIFKKPALKLFRLAVFSSSHRLNSFTAVLERLRFTCPLKGEIPASEALELVPEAASEEVFYAFALWGEKELVTAQDEYLSSLSEGKKGSWMEVEGSEFEERFIRIFQDQLAARAGRIRLWQTPTGVESDHRQVLARIQEMLL